MNLCNLKLLVEEFYRSKSVHFSNHIALGSLHVQVYQQFGLQRKDFFKRIHNVMKLGPFLTEFICTFGSGVSAHDVVDLLCVLMQNAPNLRILNIVVAESTTLSFSDEDIRALSLFIYSSKSLQNIRFEFDITLTEVKASSLAVVSVLRAMQTNTNVREFALTNCEFKISYNATLSPNTFSLSNHLKIIDLTACDLRGAEPHLLRGLSSNTSVVELILERCALDLTGENGQALTYMLENNQSLRAINLQQRSFTIPKAVFDRMKDWTSGDETHFVAPDEGEMDDGRGRVMISRSMWQINQDQVQSHIDFKCICCGLIANTSIAYLNLAGCGISVTKDDRSALFHMLQKNTSLKSLLLEGNPITAIGVSCISQGMKCNTGLEILSLQCDVNIPEVAEFVKVNSYLVSLNLSGSSLGKCFVHVVESLQSNSTLRHLRAIDCNISSSSLQPLASLQSPLESLDLSKNMIGDEGAEYIAQFLANSHCIHQLKLALCVINDRGLQCLASALELNTSLEILDLSHNRFTDTGVLSLGQSLKKNKSLKTIMIWKVSKDFVLCLCENDYLTDLYADNINMEDEIERVNQVRQGNDRNTLKLFKSSDYIQCFWPNRFNVSQRL